MNKNIRLVFTMAVLLNALHATTSLGAYNNGFVWQRSVDWQTEDNVPNTNIGQPEKDSQGNLVWQYEHTVLRGQPLGSTNPWFKGATALQVWDPSTYGSGEGGWVFVDDTAPEISQVSTNDNQHIDVFNHLPLVRWRNPVPTPFDMQITGQLIFNWYGNQGKAPNAPVDFVISRFVPSTQEYDTLYSNTFEKPHNDTRFESLSLSLFVNAHIEPGDNIIISHRCRGGSYSNEGRWVTMSDNDVKLTVIPEPATLSLLAIGGLLLRRRK